MAGQIFTNKLTRGMHGDFDPAAQPPDTYRESINGRVFFNAVNGSTSWQTSYGNTHLFQLNADYGGQPFGYVPIGGVEFADKVVILSTNGTNSEIGIVTIDPYKTTQYQNYQTIYNDLYDPNSSFVNIYKLNLSPAHDIKSIIANKENDAIQRIYWTDNYNIDRVFNVVEGLTVNNPAFVDGDYNPLVATGKYPPFYSGFSMDSIPDFSMGTMQFVQTVSGEKLSGSYQYCYRLVTKDGYKTPFTPPMLPLFLTTDDVDPANSTRYAMQASELASSKGIQVQINEIDTRYYQIEVCYIYSITPVEALNAAVFATVTINGQTTLTVADTNNGGIPVDLSLISSQYASIDTVGTLASREKRILKGNITANVPPKFNGFDIIPTPFAKRIQTDEKPISTQGLPFFSTSTYTNTTKITKYHDSSNNPVYTTHQILNDYISYSGTQVSHLYGGHFRGETYRHGILFFDLKGNPMFVFHISDTKLMEQYNATYSYTKINPSSGVVQTVHAFGTGTGDYKLTDNGRGHTSPDFPFVEITEKASVVRNTILGFMFSGIDVTDIIDEIGAFMIVRVERDPTILGQGLLFNTVKEFSGGDSNKIRQMGYPSNAFDSTRGLGWTDERGNFIYGKTDPSVSGSNYVLQPYTFTFDCPDYMFDQTVIPTLQKNHYLKTVGACFMEEDSTTGHYWGYTDAGGDPTPPVNNSRAGISNKSYFTDITGFKDAFFNDVTFGRMSSISFYVDFGFDASISGFDPANPTHVLEGYVHVGAKPGIPLQPFHDDGVFYYRYDGGIHDNALCIKSDSTSPDSIFEISMTKDTGTSRKAVCWPIVNYLINGKTPYGGVSETTLSQAIYIPTGHFQPINAAVKAQILSAGRYVFNNVEVWGGDCLVYMFQYGRIYAQNANSDSVPKLRSVAVGAAFPCEMKYNGLLKKGNTWAKSGFLDSTGHYPNGVNKDNMEPEDINSVLTASETNALYNPEPLNFVAQSDFSARWYYSNPKIDAELVDSWRAIPVNQFADMDGQFGAITGSALLYDQIYSFQERAFGRLRILDRVALQNPVDGTLKIGIGGILDYIDYTNTKVGTRNALSITNTGKAIYWVDSFSKSICRFSQNGFENLSDIHGQHNYMYSLFSSPDFNFSADNPTLRGGIHSVYDKENKEVLFTFINSQALEPTNQPLTLGWSEANDSFSSFYSFRPRKYISYGDYMLSFNEFNNHSGFDGRFYWHNNPAANIGEFYEQNNFSELTLIVNPAPDETKIFATQQMNSNDVTASGNGLFGQMFLITDQVTDNANPATDSRFRYKEGTVWYPLRGFGASSPVRGQWLQASYVFVNTGTTDMALIKSMQTTWRLSHKH